MAFCIFNGDSFRSFAIAGNEVLRIVESSICINIEVARMIGSIFFVDSKVFAGSFKFIMLI
ncbi:hypothetical protein D3C87_1319390 [compost metagenome]